LLIALAAVRGKLEPDDEDFATVQRVAEDCLPPNRLAVIEALRGAARRAAGIVRRTRLPRTTVGRALEDLALVGVAVWDGKAEDPTTLLDWGSDDL